MAEDSRPGRKVALVTGAGTGVGRAATIALAGAGFTMVLAGRRLEPLQAVAAEIDDAESLVVPADVADPAAVDALFDAIRERFGRLDLLFNNAGTGVTLPTEELTFQQWQHVVGVNLTGSFLCAQAAVKLMKAQSPSGGRIINNGSISAHTPRPNTIAYTATKHAITGLTKSLALDGRAHGITCGQIDIGNASTPMTERMAEGVLQPDGSTRAEPRMDVEDVGRAVVYMATLPPAANVLFMTVMANGMPFVGRG
jgi:NAD(P)-dependent dehydrogenase (short-subunit alcohol dehydrogenase family)